jgi:GDPmannose 4,6-dehydratase
MSRSLVIGVNGQDGSYLAEALLQRGHEVLGCARDEMSRYVKPVPRFTYEKMDLRDLASLDALLQRWEPDSAFHFAAVHGAAGFEYEEKWRDMMTVNVLSLHVLLEHARLRAPAMRISYAGSAKMFPAPLTGTIDESTPARATCLYSIGKIASRDLIVQYREKHGVAATNLVLFNHESVRRPPSYFLPTIARSIASAKTNPSFRTNVKTLDFWIDWSAADEFMEIAIDLAERSNLAEVILASGKTWHGRAAVEDLFARHHLDFRNHIIETLPLSEPGPNTEFHVDIAQLVKATGRRPVKSLSHVVDQMIDAVNEAPSATAGSG